MSRSVQFSAAVLSLLALLATRPVWAQQSSASAMGQNLSADTLQPPAGGLPLPIAIDGIAGQRQNQAGSVATGPMESPFIPGNSATLTQIGHGNSAQATQLGLLNSLTQTQIGNNNPVSATQIGIGNSLITQQYGNNITGLTVTQSGGAHATVTQFR